MQRGVKGVDCVVFGAALLVVNLTSRHLPAVHSDLLIWTTGWIGSILIVVVVGALLFLDQER
jgi:hypothetical protein